MAGDSYLLLFDGFAYESTVKPVLRRLRQGEGMELAESLLARHPESPNISEQEIADAIGAVREFYLWRDTDELGSEEANAALFRCGSRLFSMYCRYPATDPELIDLTGTGLVYHLANQSLPWRGFLGTLGKHPDEADLVACLGPGSWSLGEEWLGLCEEVQAIGPPKSKLGRMAFERLRTFCLRLRLDSKLRLAHVQEW